MRGVVLSLPLRDDVAVADDKSSFLLIVHIESCEGSMFRAQRVLALSVNTDLDNNEIVNISGFPLQTLTGARPRTHSMVPIL